jgi:hypothetical protein
VDVGFKKLQNSPGDFLRTPINFNRETTIPPVLSYVNKDDSSSKIKTQIQKEEKKITVKSNQLNKPQNVIKRFFAVIVNSYIFIVFMTLCTLFALFTNDVQAAFLPSQTDETFNNIQALLLFIFSIEIFMTFLAKKEYRNSFFFWLDVIATVSLIQDVDWMFEPLVNIG